MGVEEAERRASFSLGEGTEDVGEIGPLGAGEQLARSGEVAAVQELVQLGGGAGSTRRRVRV